MLTSLLKSALRQISAHRGEFLVSTLALTMGITCSLLILAHVAHEMNYDAYHKNADRVHRLTVSHTILDQTYKKAVVTFPLAKLASEEMVSVETSTNVYYPGEVYVQAKGKIVLERGLIHVDPEFFEVFTFPTILGEREPLTEPHHVVLTESAARKYYGEDDPIGQTFVIEGSDYTVNAVVEDVPVTSHLHFDAIILFDYDEYPWMNSWRSYGYLYIYLMVDDLAAVPLIEERLNDKIEKRAQLPDGETLAVSLQPIRQIHVYSHGIGVIDGIEQNTTRPGTLMVLLAIGGILLGTAGINAANIFTGRFEARVSEFAIRRIIGGSGFWQFSLCLVEAAILVGGALLVSIAICEALLGSQLGLSLGLKVNDWREVNLGVLSVGSVCIGLAALAIGGILPALLASTRGTSRNLLSYNQSVRRILTVCQFSGSIGLMIVAMHVQSQIDYMLQRDLGWEEKGDIVLPVFDAVPGEKYKVVKEAFLRNAGIAAATASKVVPLLGGALGIDTHVVGDSQRKMAAQLCVVDHDFVDYFNIDLKAGNKLWRDCAEEENQDILINEEAARLLGYERAEDAIGARLQLPINNWVGEVIGVIGSFHLESLHTPVQPQILIYWPNLLDFTHLIVRPSSPNHTEVVRSLENAWDEMVPLLPFRFLLLDNMIRDVYAQDRQSRDLVFIAGLISCVLSAIGIFGVARVATGRRRKEVAIRKVMGSSVWSLMLLLLKEFLVMMLIANAIAWPIAGLASNEWLAEFAYRIDLQWWIFVWCGLLASLVTVLSVSNAVILTARSNPTEALRLA